MDYGQILALISGLAGSPEAVPPPSQNVEIQPCPRALPIYEVDGKTVICGTVRVPEDRSKPDGKQIGIQFVVLKAESPFPEPDPVVYLEGGPGGSAIRDIQLVDRIFKPFRKRRDVVTFDQRSAGLSGSSVNCFAAMSERTLDLMLPGGLSEGGIPKADTIKACVDELTATKVPLPLYNTSENARVVSQVMTSLGYKDYNLYGISYGTKLALEVMRTAPEGVRSVVIDGVAPPWVHLYDSAALKNDEVIHHLVEQCAADKACNDHFPDLGKVINEVMARAAAGDITIQGTKVDVETSIAPILLRNGKYNERPTTRYLPAYMYELWRGKETPTVELLFGKNFSIPAVGEADVRAAAAGLNGEQKYIVEQVLDGAAVAARGELGIARSVAALRNSLEGSRQLGPVARLFDSELSAAMVEAVKADKEQVRAALADYTAMQTAAPSKDVLSGYVRAHVKGAAKDRLLALIDSMSPAELEGSFAIIRRDSYTAFNKFLTGWYLDVYACQEDRPYNSMEGYQATMAQMKYPGVAVVSDPLAKAFIDGCSAFGMHERPNWHEPVASDIPTLSIGSLFDIQTPASWSKMAVEKLGNAQLFMIPESGHGALAYQPCVGQMGVAFVDNPKRKFGNTCAESIRIDWHVPAWAQKP